MQAGDTLRVRGEGGGEFDLDVPEEGTEQRKLFEMHLASGFLTILAAPASGHGDAAPPEHVAQPPDGPIADVTAWVRGAADDDEPAADGWPERAAQALAAEEARPKPRAGLVKALKELTA